MLVVVASRHDRAASDLVKKWTPYGAGLLTCEDLSTPGWRYRIFDLAESRVVVAGKVVPESEVRGVLVRRPWILNEELSRIRSSDREYVAAEMNAFLLSWLAGLRCRVLNRPSGTCLCGPNWRPIQWADAAARAGFYVEGTSWRVPAKRTERRAQGAVPVRFVDLTLVGNKCFGATEEVHAAGARRLAALAGVRLLGVRIAQGKRGAAFISASAMPSLRDPDVAQAVCDHLLAEPGAEQAA